MNENWSLHLTLLNNRTGQKIGANYPKNKYEILEMLDRCQIPYGSGDYAHLAVPFPDGTPDSLQLKLAGVIENEHCPPSIRQVNFLAEQLQRMSAESREALMQELTDMPMAVITDVIRIAGRLLSELPLPQTIDLSERAVLLTEQEPYFRLNVAALESESTEDGVLPREMIESIGKGPATEDGFRTSPEFIIWEDGMYEAFRLQLVEEKTGLPDFAGTDDLPPTQSTLYYLRVICVERGQRTIMEAIQIWDTSYANVRKEIKSVVDRRLQQSVDSLWGIEALPFLKQYLLYPYAPEDLAEDLLKELANQSEAGGDTAGFVSTQEHFLAAPRNMRGLQDSSLIQNAHVSLSRQAGSGHPRHFLKVRNTIPPRFTSLLEIREANAAAIQKELERLLGYLAEVERLRNPLAPSGGAAATGEGQGNAH